MSKYQIFNINENNLISKFFLNESTRVLPNIYIFSNYLIKKHCNGQAMVCANLSRIPYKAYSWTQLNSNSDNSIQKMPHSLIQHQLHSLSSLFQLLSSWEVGLSWTRICLNLMWPRQSLKVPIKYLLMS
jgi:hypothetical protein